MCFNITCIDHQREFVLISFYLSDLSPTVGLYWLRFGAQTSQSTGDPRLVANGIVPTAGGSGKTSEKW